MSTRETIVHAFLCLMIGPMVYVYTLIIACAYVPLVKDFLKEEKIVYNSDLISERGEIWTTSGTTIEWDAPLNGFIGVGDSIRIKIVPYSGKQTITVRVNAIIE